jgi:hypothetical protein
MLREAMEGLLLPLVRVWITPQRYCEIVRRFALTEKFTALDIRAVAERTHDPVLRDQLRQHARDENRHAVVFSRWATVIAPGEPAQNSVEQQIRDLHRLSRSVLDRSAPNIHFSSDLGYMLFLALAEVRAFLFFSMYRIAGFRDAGCRRYLPGVVRDERRHFQLAFQYVLKESRPVSLAVQLSRVAAYLTAQQFKLTLQWFRRASSAFISLVFFSLVVIPYGLVLRLLRLERRSPPSSQHLNEDALLNEAYWHAP